MYSLSDKVNYARRSYTKHLHITQFSVTGCIQSGFFCATWFVVRLQTSLFRNNQTVSPSLIFSFWFNCCFKWWMLTWMTAIRKPHQWSIAISPAGIELVICSVLSTLVGCFYCSYYCMIKLAFTRVFLYIHLKDVEINYCVGVNA